MILEWEMPAPPPEFVLSVIDYDGREWLREDHDGVRWSSHGGLQWRSWIWLLTQRSPLTAGKLAEQPADRSSQSNTEDREAAQA